MTVLPFNANTATRDQIVKFMEWVWSDVCESTNDGGMIINHAPGDDVYNEWHNALKVMSAIDAKEIAHDDEWKTFRLLNGEELLVQEEGNGVQ